jgi:hypothetical protein
VHDRRPINAQHPLPPNRPTPVRASPTAPPTLHHLVPAHWSRFKRHPTILRPPITPIPLSKCQSRPRLVRADILSSCLVAAWCDRLFECQPSPALSRSDRDEQTCRIQPALYF